MLVRGTGPFCPSALELLVTTGFLLHSQSGVSYLGVSKCGAYPVGEFLSTNPKVVVQNGTLMTGHE